MGKGGGGSAPAPTSPEKTAKADFGADIASMGAVGNLQTPNLYSPGGSVLFGKTDQPDVSIGGGETLPGGKGIDTVTTQFSPELQGVWETPSSKGGDFAGLLPSQGFTPNIDSSRLRQSYIDEGLRDVRSTWDDEDNKFGVVAAERGIPIGSEIWRGERDRIDSQRADYTQGLTNQAHEAAAADEARQLQQQIALHQMPWTDFSNYYNALSGMQSQLQGGPSSPLMPAQAPNVDVAGITARADDAKMRNYQAQQAQAGAGMNAGLGLFGSVLGGLFGMSDERTKEDIKKVGETDDGQNIYTYKYKWDGPGAPTHMGLMAREVERHNPDAVHEVGGVKFVDYERATEGASLASFLRHGGA